MGADAACPKCGGQAQVIPGELYRASEAALFDQIESAVNAHALTPTEMLAITVELINIVERTRAPAAMLSRIVVLLPALHFLADESQHDNLRMVRGMGMLLAIVGPQGHGSRQRESLPDCGIRSIATALAARSGGGSPR
jgi:hypothetical protein